MKIIKKILRSNVSFFVVVVSAILALNLAPMIMQYRHSPPGRTYGLIHNNVQDFYFYQAIMNQGANGGWLIYDPYTTEPHNTSFIFSYFTLFGKISNILKTPHAVTYHIIRIVSAVLFFWAAFLLIKKLKSPYPKLTFLLFVFASPLMHIINEGGQLTKVPYMKWWTGMDAIRRASYLPHHMIGAAFLILSVIEILNYFKQKSKTNLILLILYAIIMAFFHTPSLFIILVALPPAIIIYEFRILLHKIFLKKSTSTKQTDALKKSFSIPKTYIFFLAYWIIGILLILLMLTQTQRGFPWNVYITWERDMQFPLLKELAPALGMLLPFAVIGIALSVMAFPFKYIFVASWFVSPFLLIPLAKTLRISNVRLIQGVPYLPLAILAVAGLFYLQKSVKYLLVRIVKEQKITKLISRYLYYFAFVIIFAYLTIPTLSWSIQDQIREYWPIFGNVYLDDRLFETFDYINKNFPDKTKTLSIFYSGNYLPAYTNTISFIGHFGYTYNVKEKEPLADKFFKGEMTVQEAKSLILDNKIDLIFQGPEEKSINNKYLYPEILETVYDKDVATIYMMR